MIETPLETLVKRKQLDPVARVTEDDIIAWAGSLSDPDFYNAISLQIAEGYQKGVLSYEFCDAVMNNLWAHVTHSVLTSKNSQVPDPFYDIYEAFDAGEYYRNADRSDDPVAERTNPMIDEILLHHARHSGNSAG